MRKLLSLLLLFSLLIPIVSSSRNALVPPTGIIRPSIIISNGTGGGNFTGYWILNVSNGEIYRIGNAKVYGNFTVTDTAFFANQTIYIGGVKITESSSGLLDVEGEMNATFYRGSGLYLTDINVTNATFAQVAAGTICLSSEFMTGNGTCINSSDAGVDTIWLIDATTLLNNSGVLEVRESWVNDTIDDRVGIQTETIQITVTSGVGTGSSSILSGSNEILDIRVTPTSSSNQFRFQANGTTSGDMADRNLREHTGEWHIAHRGSIISGESISYYITSASIDENFNVTVRYKR